MCLLDNKASPLIAARGIARQQVLTESARRVQGAGVFEQGAGTLNLVGAFELLGRYTPRATFLPASLDLTDPYMWPFSRQVS